MTFEGSHSATSSPASACGATHCDSPVGRTIAQFGLAPALASLSARQAKAAGLLMSGTFGPRGSISSSGANDLTYLSLVSRLRARTASRGSTLYGADLEGTGHACWPVDLCAAGVGAPHIRQRLFFVAHAGAPGLSVREREVVLGAGRREEGRAVEQRRGASALGMADAAGPTNGFWRDADWLLCRDGRWRPVEPGSFPLAHGAPARVGRLRGTGNAISPQVAEAFISTYLELTE